MLLGTKKTQINLRDFYRQIQELQGRTNNKTDRKWWIYIQTLFGRKVESQLGYTWPINVVAQWKKR